jgi:hypothetical protein
MQRFGAILLLLVFGSFLSAPLLAATSDPYSNLPACCKRSGKHHCMMRMTMERNLETTQVAAPADKCPFFPHSILIPSLLNHPFVVQRFGLFYAAVQSHPAYHAQTEAQRRISFDRAKQKRGPPAESLLS